MRLAGWACRAVQSHLQIPGERGHRAALHRASPPLALPGAQHGHWMDTLVTQWRKLWGEGNFPFYAVQLPGQQNVSNNPLIREEQAKILSLPNTGLAGVMDTSEAKNVHPKNKEPLGDRLTKIALATDYNQTDEF